MQSKPLPEVASPPPVFHDYSVENMQAMIAQMKELSESLSSLTFDIGQLGNTDFYYAVYSKITDGSYLRLDQEAAEVIKRKEVTRVMELELFEFIHIHRMMVRKLYEKAREIALCGQSTSNANVKHIVHTITTTYSVKNNGFYWDK